jgi:hypothetical protein
MNMATMKKTTTGGGDGATALALPEGYTTGKSKFYAEAVALRFATLPPAIPGRPTQPSVRLLLVANKETTDEQVRGLLNNPRMGLAKRAPGIWQAFLQMKDMDNLIGPNTGSGKLFRWIDVASRFYGLNVNAPTDAVRVVIGYEGEDVADARKKLKQLGVSLETIVGPNLETDGEWLNPDIGLLIGTTTGDKLYDLTLWTKASAIEVRGVNPADSSKG